jgi:hypothetical protein
MVYHVYFAMVLHVKRTIETVIKNWPLFPDKGIQLLHALLSMLNTFNSLGHNITKV